MGSLKTSNVDEKVFFRENNEYLSAETIYNLFDYTPEKYFGKCGLEKEMETRKCWDFKDIKSYSAQVQSKIFNEILQQLDTILFFNIVICCVPSSQAMDYNNCVVLLVQELARRGRVDGSSFLQRTENIQPRKQKGADRSTNIHFKTIRVNSSHIFKDRTVLLLDDVTTTGNSMHACSQLLMQNGASKVFKLSIWKTNHS